MEYLAVVFTESAGFIRCLSIRSDLYKYLMTKKKKKQRKPSLNFQSFAAKLLFKWKGYVSFNFALISFLNQKKKRFHRVKIVSLS